MEGKFLLSLVFEALYYRGFAAQSMAKAETACQKADKNCLVFLHM